MYSLIKHIKVNSKSVLRYANLGKETITLVIYISGSFAKRKSGSSQA